MSLFGGSYGCFMASMKTWQEMVASNEALLNRKTGEDARTWTTRARDAGIESPGALKTWLAEQNVTGYSALAVEWDMFGVPEFMQQGADELIDGQYADRTQLRPVADALLGWAERTNDVVIQVRRTYVSLQTSRRKFAQITPATKSAVDLLLRLQAAVTSSERLERIKVAKGDTLTHRVRLRSVDEVDEEVLGILESARKQNGC